MGVFGDYALKYYESGIYVIPTNEKKEPKVKDGFKEDAKKLNVVESWVGKYPDANIAVLMGVGKMQNIVAFDIDLDGPLWEDATAEENMTKAAFCLPYSPVFKKGKKGITIFYRCYFQYQKPNGKKIIDFITSGYTVIPPSLYYEKKDLSLNEKYNYKWGPYDLLSFDPEGLPELKQEDVDRFFGIFGEDLPKGKKLENGRDNHISEMCWAALHKNKPRDVVIKELLEIDQRMHETPFATDKKESKTRGRTPEEVMAHFVDRAIKKLGDKYQPGLEVILSAEDLDIYELPVFNAGPMPHLHHMITSLGYYLNQSVYQNLETSREILALATFGAIIGNARYLRYEKLISYPNFYITMLQDSTDGKTALTDAVNHIFSSLGLNDRFQNGLKTEAGLLSLFSDQRREIVLNIGEFHTVLEEIEKPGEYSGNLLAFLSDHYTKTGMDYKVPKIKSSEEKVILTPNISIIASTQPESLSSYIEPLSEQGFFGRFLISRDSSNSLFRNKLSKKEENDFLVSMLIIVNCLKQADYHKRPIGFAAGHQLLVEDGFYEELSKIYLDYKTRKDKETNRVLKNLYGRANHLLAKLVVVLGVCDLWDGRSIIDKQNQNPFKTTLNTVVVPTVATLENLEKAVNWLEWYFKYATQFAIPLLPGPMGLILDAIQKKGKAGLSFKELMACSVVRKQNYETTQKHLNKLSELGYIVSTGSKDWQKVYYALKLD